MSRGILGAAVGAGGATAYYNKDAVGEAVRVALTPSWLTASNSSGGSSGTNRQIDDLSKMVQQLSQDVQRRGNGGITILRDTHRGNGVAMYVAVASIGGVLYLRMVKGWKLGDMLYVTRAGLKQSVSHVTEGLDGLGQRMNSMKAFLLLQIRGLSAKQDECAAAQAEMKGQLHTVATDVEHTRNEVSEIHGAVRDLEGGLEDISLNQQYSNRGIYILCKVVGELMKGGTSSPAGAELEDFIKHQPIFDRRSVPGLEAVPALAQYDAPIPPSRSTGQHTSNAMRRNAAVEQGQQYGFEDRPDWSYSANSRGISGVPLQHGPRGFSYGNR